MSKMIKNRKLFLVTWTAIILAIAIVVISSYSSIVNGLEEIFRDGNSFFSAMTLCVLALNPFLGILIFLAFFALSFRNIFVVLYLALVICVIVYVSCALFKRFEYTSEERTFENLKKALESSNPRAFATNIDDLIKKIAGEKIRVADKRAIKTLIQPKINKITDFIRGDESKDSVLLVDGAWGSGKTTAVMLGLEKGDQKNFRYIYSSAFKYTSATNEFSKDLVASIFDTLEQFGLFVDTSAAKALLSNISSEPTNLLSSLLPEDENAGKVTPELVGKINEAYSNANTDLKIIVIIDDMDRLQGEDVLKTLSLLSVLRKFSFVKIIIPADLTAIKKMLEKAEVYSPETFVEKYLPESSAVEISYGRQFVGKIVISKIIAIQTKKRVPEAYNPAWAAILFGLLSKKMEIAVKNSEYENFDWLKNYSASNNGSIPEHLRTFFEAKNAISSKWRNDGTLRGKSGRLVDQRYKWNDSSMPYSFETIITSIYDRVDERSVPKCFYDTDYHLIVESWFFQYAKENWKKLGITIRDVLDFVNELNLENINGESAQQFVEMFNRIFGTDTLVYQDLEEETLKKTNKGGLIGRKIVF